MVTAESHAKQRAKTKGRVLRPEELARLRALGERRKGIPLSEEIKKTIRDGIRAGHARRKAAKLAALETKESPNG
jgi:hypothetical protein